MTNPGEKDIHRMALEALPLGVYAVNREGKVILWSAGAEKLTDYLRQDVLGRLHESDLLKRGEEDQKRAQDSAEPQQTRYSPGPQLMLHSLCAAKTGVT